MQMRSDKEAYEHKAKLATKSAELLEAVREKHRSLIRAADARLLTELEEHQLLQPKPQHTPCFDVDPGGQQGWADAEDDIQDGLKRLRAPQGLITSAQGDLVRSRTAFLVERFFDPKRNLTLPTWLTRLAPWVNYKPPSTSEFAEMPPAQQASWKCHLDLLMRGEQRLPSITGIQIPNQSSVNADVAKRIRNEIARRLLQMQAAHKTLRETLAAYDQVLKASALLQDDNANASPSA